MKNKIKKYFLISLLCIFGACDYLDVVPDNIATIDNAFVNRTMTEKFLFTCYSYMPQHTIFLADEFWCPYPQYSQYYWNNGFQVIARGNQNVVSPEGDYWSGSNSMFTALRDCNIFLERMEGHIPALQEYEKKRWVAEVLSLLVSANVRPDSSHKNKSTNISKCRRGESIQRTSG